MYHNIVISLELNKEKCWLFFRTFKNTGVNKLLLINSNLIHFQKIMLHFYSECIFDDIKLSTANYHLELDVLLLKW